RAERGLGDLETIGPGAETRPCRFARFAQRLRKGTRSLGLLCSAGRVVSNEFRRDDQAAGRIHARAPAALSAASYLGEIRVGQEVWSTGSQTDTSTVDQQSLEPG